MGARAGCCGGEEEGALHSHRVIGRRLRPEEIRTGEGALAHPGLAARARQRGSRWSVGEAGPQGIQDDRKSCRWDCKGGRKGSQIQC